MPSKREIDNIWDDEEPVASRAGGLLVVWASLLAIALAVALAFLTHEQANPAPSATLAERVESINVARASDQLAAQASESQRELTSALFERDLQTMARLVRLQADSAQLTLVGFKLAEQPRDNLIQPIEVDLTVSGAYYDLPIFIDGLFRNKWIVTVKSVTVESRAAMAVQVTSRILVQFYRPVEIPASYLEELVAAQGVSKNSAGFTASALRDASRLISYEDFVRKLPELEDKGKKNRRLVLRTIPTMVRKLPSSPMDWIGAVFEGEEAVLATER